MNAYLQLTLAQLRVFSRNRQVLFWTLFFPIFLMVTLGSFLGNGNGVTIEVGVVDQEKSEESIALLQTFKDTAGLDVKAYLDEAAANENLENGEVQLIVIIPKGYSEQIKHEKADREPLNIPVLYNETNLTSSQVGITVLSQVIDQTSKEAVQYKPIVQVEAKGVQAIQLRYIDFLVPGIVAMMIMSNNMNGVAGQISSWRERGILRRMQGTTLKASTFIAAQITARLLLNGSQALLVLVIANLIFDIDVRGSWLVLIGFVILGILAFMSMGFIIAGIAKTPESAGPIAAFVSFPMLFLGGVFFPIKNMPEFLQPIVNILPISHLSNALRETMNIGTPLIELWPETTILFGWLIGSFIIASYTFKWE